MATKFPPPSPPFIRARHQGGRQTPKAIVLHGTVSSDDRGTARNIAQWWNGPDSPMSSCHYVVDPGMVIQCVGDHNIAYHCGYNTGSIGVEFCDEQQGPASRWADKDSVAILKRAAHLVAELCLAYDIDPVRPSVADLKRKGPHGIYGHNDSRLAFGGTTHTDPRDFPWPLFMAMVKDEIADIRAEAAGPKKTFKVLHAPLHGVSATRSEIRKALRRKRVVTVAFSEAYRQGDFLATRTRWRATMGGREEDARGRMVERDIAILTKRIRGRKHLEHDTIKIADASTPLKIAPERFLSYSVDLLEGKPLAVIALHPHAAVRNAWESDRANEFRNSMRKLQALIRLLRIRHGNDLDVIVLGDLNYPNIDDGRYWTPRGVFTRLGLSWIDRGIDWVASSPGLKRVSDVQIPKGVNGQDHPWIEVEFQRQ